MLSHAQIEYHRRAHPRGYQAQVWVSSFQMWLYGTWEGTKRESLNALKKMVREMARDLD